MNIIEKLGMALSESSGKAGGASLQPMSRAEANEARRGLKVTLTPAPRIEKLYFDFPRVLITPGLIDHFEPRPITKDETKFFNEKENLFNQNFALKMSFTPKEAGLRWKSQLKNLAKACQHGEVQVATAAEVSSREIIDLEFAAKMHAAKVAQRSVSNEVQHAVAKVATRLAASALKFHDELVVEEKKRFEKFGIPFTPSRIVVSFGQLSWLLHHVCGASTGLSPRAQLAAIGVKL